MTQRGKEVATKADTPLAKLQAIGKDIDTIIEETLPMSTKAAASFVESLAIAKGIGDLRAIMLNSPEIERVVMHMANNRLGFLTDRSPAALAANARRGKGPTKAYAYRELVDAVIEGLLKGYRISGNEMNIIAGNFYAAKAGTYRRVTEFPGLTNFQYGNQPVDYRTGQQQYARVKCWASWKLNGQDMTIGIDQHDDATFQVRINAMMGEDAVIGKAHAKLFKRVLERITGQVQPEVTELDPGDYIDVEVTKPRDALAGPETKGRDIDLYKQTNQSPPAAPATKTPEAPTSPSPKQDQPPAAPPTETSELDLALEEMMARVHAEFSDPNLARKGIKVYCSQREITVGELAKEIQAFPTSWDDLKGYIMNLDLFPDEEGGQEEQQEQQEEAPPASWWDHHSNWVHRRSTPFLYLVRVGLGLPHANIEVKNTDGDITRMEFIAQHEKEQRENPEAWDTLLDASPETVERLDNKIADMGFPSLLGEWTAEKLKLDKAHPRNQRKEEVDDLQINLPDDFNGPAAVVEEWDKYKQSHPQIMAAVIGRLGIPAVTGDAINILNIVRTQISYDEDGGQY